MQRYTFEQKVNILEKWLFENTVRELPVSPITLRLWAENEEILKEIARRKGISLEEIKEIKNYRKKRGSKPWKKRERLEEKKGELLELLRKNPRLTYREICKAGYSSVLYHYFHSKITKAKTEALGKEFKKYERYSEKEMAEYVEKYLFDVHSTELPIDGRVLAKWCKDDTILEKVANNTGFSLEAIKIIRNFRKKFRSPFNRILQASKLRIEGRRWKEIHKELKIRPSTLQKWLSNEKIKKIIEEKLGKITLPKPRRSYSEIEKRKYMKDYLKGKSLLAAAYYHRWFKKYELLNSLLDDLHLPPIFSLSDLLQAGCNKRRAVLFLNKLLEKNVVYKVGNYFTKDKKLVEKLKELQERKAAKRGFSKIEWKEETKTYELNEVIKGELLEPKEKCLITHKSKVTEKKENCLLPTQPPPIIKLLLDSKLNEKEMEEVYKARSVISSLALFKNLEKELKEPILDLGCGPTSPVLRSTDKYVICLDKNKEYLKFLKEKNKEKNADFVQADARYLPFAPNKIESITMTYLLNEMGIEDVFNILVETRRISKNGRIYIEMPAGRKALEKLKKLLNAMNYDFSVKLWRSEFSDKSSNNSYLIKIPSYTKEEIESEFLNFLRKDKVVFLKEGISMWSLPPTKVSISEIENLVEKPKYELENALNCMSEIYEKLKKNGKVSEEDLIEIGKKYGIEEFIGPGKLISIGCKVTTEGIEVYPCRENQFWVAASIFEVWNAREIENKVWKKLGPILEAYKHLH